MHGGEILVQLLRFLFEPGHLGHGRRQVGLQSRLPSGVVCAERFRIQRVDTALHGLDEHLRSREALLNGRGPPLPVGFRLLFVDGFRLGRSGRGLRIRRRRRRQRRRFLHRA